MDWGIIATIISAVALIGVVVAVVTYRKQFPKRRLIWRAEATPLLSSDPVAAKLTVSFAGERISDPHLLRVSIRSASRADIPSSAFDSGRPTTFAITPDPFVLSQTETLDGAIGVTWTSTRGFMYSGIAQIEPQLIRKGAEGEFVVVTDGLPRLQVDATLPDIPVEPDTKVAKSPPASLIAASSAMLGGILTAFVAEFWAATTAWGSYLALAGALVTLVASVYGIVIMHTERRAEKRRVETMRGTTA